MATVGAALAGASIPLIVLSWGLLLIGQVLSGLRWGEIATHLGSVANRPWFVRTYLRGCFYNVFLPTGIGGDALRIAVLRRELGTRRAGRSVIVDRVAGLAAVGLAAAIALPWTTYVDRPAATLAIGAAGVAATTVIAAWLVRKGFALFAWWTLLFDLAWFVGVWVLARSIGVDLELLALPIVMLIVGVAIALPLSIGGTGTREAGFVAALAPLGISTDDAVAIGICFGIVLALVGIVGAPLSVASDAAPLTHERAEA
jgi:uncharacterized membrane protein YbhN (UPF0104 family)